MRLQNTLEGAKARAKTLVIQQKMLEFRFAQDVLVVVLGVPVPLDAFSYDNVAEVTPGTGLSSC